jgi:protease YdgD
VIELKLEEGLGLNRYSIRRALLPIVGILAAVAPGRAQTLQTEVAHLAQGNIIEAKAYPWSAIGKLNNGMGGSCTAVMISPTYALTAAHCLFLSETGQFIPAQSFHLILGYENQQFEDHFRISAYYIPPTYQFRKAYETLASDWALLSLTPAQRLTHNPSYISLNHALAAAAMLMTGGYSQRTPYAMTADRHCTLVGWSHDRQFIFDSCKAPAGYSGAPVLVKSTNENSVSIAGIHVANQIFKTNTIAIAIPITQIWPKIKSCVESHQCQFQHVATGRDPTASELLAGLPGFSERGHLELSSSCTAADPNCTTSIIDPK